MTMWLSLGTYILVLFLLFVLRKRLGLFTSVSVFVVSSVAYIKYGIEPPIPASIAVLYIATLLIAVLLYVTSSEEGREAFFGPIVAMMVEPRLWIVRWGMLLCVPALLAWQGYEFSLPGEAPPPRTRQVHPPVPSTIKFQGPEESTARTVDLIKEVNPLRALEESDPDQFNAKVAAGKTIYYQNCFFCHGDHLAADGHYATAVKPVPATFQDPGTLPMLEEAFLFWRVAKGGPGLPDAATPWDSSMPVWEKFLSEDEIWSVIMFLYDHTGFSPRGKEEVH